LGERILICGDRNWNNIKVIQQVLSEFLSEKPIDCVIEGECRGADTLGWLAASKMGIKVLKFPAKWEDHGKAAGPIRNQRMLDEGKPTIVLAFHNNIEQSKGTADMVQRARKVNIPVQIYTEAALHG